MQQVHILRKPEGGDRRSIGRSKAVVAEVLPDGTLFSGLFAGLFVDDSVVRARAADAVEKISVVHPEYLRPYRAKLAANSLAVSRKNTLARRPNAASPSVEYARTATGVYHCQGLPARL